MRTATNILGIILILLGISVFVYQGLPGFTYTKQENIAQIGDVKMVTDEVHTIYIPPVLGGVSIVVGIILMAIGRRK